MSFGAAGTLSLWKSIPIPISISILKKENPDKRMHLTLILPASDLQRYPGFRLYREVARQRKYFSPVIPAESNTPQPPSRGDGVGCQLWLEFWNPAFLKVGSSGFADCGKAVFFGLHLS
jgi:hypothetical protein